MELAIILCYFSIMYRTFNYWIGISKFIFMWLEDSLVAWLVDLGLWLRYNLWISKGYFTCNLTCKINLIYFTFNKNPDRLWWVCIAIRKGFVDVLIRSLPNPSGFHPVLQCLSSIDYFGSSFGNSVVGSSLAKTFGITQG